MAQITVLKWDIVISYMTLDPIISISPCNALPIWYRLPHYFLLPQICLHQRPFAHLFLSELLPVLPIYIARNPTQALQRPIPHLDTAKLDHPRIQSQRRPYIILNLGGGIVAHDKVVSVCILRLMLAGFLGKVEDTPVVKTPDRATAAEDEWAGCACNSVRLLEICCCCCWLVARRCYVMLVVERRRHTLLPQRGCPVGPSSVISTYVRVNLEQKGNLRLQWAHITSWRYIQTSLSSQNLSLSLKLENKVVRDGKT